MKKPRHERALKLNKDSMPVSVDDGDEFYPNGIFVFNITKMLEFIHNHPDEFIPVPVSVKDHAENDRLE